LSLSPGFVVPYKVIKVSLTAKSTIVGVKVKFPSLGTETPLPFLNCLAIYDPNPFHIALTVFSSIALLCC